MFILCNLVKLHLERLYILSLYIALGFHVEFRGGTQGHQQQNRRRRARACMGEGHVPRRVCTVRASNQFLKYNLEVPVMEAVKGGAAHISVKLVLGFSSDCAFHFFPYGMA